MNKYTINFPSGSKAFYDGGDLHREDGPAIEGYNGGGTYWFLHGYKLNLEESINDPKLQAKYPKLIEAMIIYLVHES